MSRRFTFQAGVILVVILLSVWPIIHFQQNANHVVRDAIAWDESSSISSTRVAASANHNDFDAVTLNSVSNDSATIVVPRRDRNGKSVKAGISKLGHMSGTNNSMAGDIKPPESSLSDDFRTPGNTFGILADSTPAPQNAHSPYAYVFAIWRLDPDNSHYKGYFATILIATRILRLCGSNADFVVIIKLHYDSSHHTLPQEDLDLLRGMKIRILYLPQEDDDRHLNICGTMFHKFAIFNLTEYRQVMYLDSDVMPMNNLDYLMKQADHGFLKHQVVVASNREPSNGGIMIVRPNATVYQDIQRIIQSWGPHLGKRDKWDEIVGWGHAIGPPDQWETNTKRLKGRKWNFWAANADQGFLYHYCKYALKDRTQILARKVINFGPVIQTPSAKGNKASIVKIEQQWNVTSITTSPFVDVAPPKAFGLTPNNCATLTSSSSPGWPGCVPPYRDFRHYTGRSKPWKQDRPATTRRRTPTSSDHVWWHTLVELRDEEGLNASSLGIRLPY